MSSDFPLLSINETMFLSAFFFTLSVLCLSIFIFSLVSKRRRSQLLHHHGRENLETRNAFVSVINSNTAYSPEIRVDNQDNIQTDLQGKTSRSESDSNQELSRSLLLDILPSDSSKWAQLFSDDIFGKKDSDLDGFPVGVEEEDDEEKKKSKKKKKRRKKKRLDPNECSEEVMKKEKKEELVCLYPFTTSTSATQRKIKQQYDQFVKSHESNGLTQVERFINCLVESKKELEHRSKVTKRKFTIAKALLLKADRSSFDRISQQICKLASEQKRIEEDASVYNWHREQLKLSPAYKKMLEISKIKEMKAKSCEKAENMENETDDISFEELLAQEKKDAFWQRRKI